MSPMVPTIHMNGTSLGELQTQLMDALQAVDAAVDALRRACPNGRDYYPQGDRAIHDALREHGDRVARLAAVRDELTTIAEAVS